MSTNLTDISNAIINKLNGISGLNGVYNYEVATPTNGQYPFATVTTNSEDGVFGDTIRNVRTNSFAIRIYQERTQAAFGDSKAENIIRIICDSIITAFDADTTLGGTVKWVKPLKANFRYVSRETGDTRVAEFTADCITVVPSTT